MNRCASTALVAVIVVAACGGAVASTGSPVSTESPATITPSPSGSGAPPTGTIVYAKIDEDDRWQIWTSCADLSGARLVPTEPGHDAGWPAWSPDGARIAFNSDADDPDLTDSVEVWNIYTMDRAGGDVRKLTNSAGLAGDPSYSPDGKLIAFDSTEAGKEGIWVMDAADGANQRLVAPLAEGSRTDYAPRFSPNGSQLVFTRDVSDTEAALWVVNVDGTGLRRITPDMVIPDKAAWSHDGRTIVFNAYTDDPDLSTIWLVQPDGEGLDEVDTPPTPGLRDGYSKPVWSPDDSLILVTHGVHDANGPRQVALATVRPDGTDLRWAGDGRGLEKYPEWSGATC